MSRSSYDSITSLKPGKYDWKIKVRVIRNWRGATSSGQTFKAFNVIVIDQQGGKIHAFVPGKCATQHELSLHQGKTCIIKNFTVQPYKEEEKFRPVHSQNQLIFSTDTKIKEVDEKENCISEDSFDFYDHNDLKHLADKTPYLLDVVGIIENQDSMNLREIVTSLGKNKLQTKFQISDGSSKISVTLWDALAQKLHTELMQQQEEPVIIILSCCRCGTWNKEVDLSNVGATSFYLNYNHHSVKHIRKMIATPQYTQRLLSKQNKKQAEMHTIADIKKLGPEYIEASVILQANIRFVDETNWWFYYACTECNLHFETGDDKFRCSTCKRRIPHPEKKFLLNVIASDGTEPIELILDDRQVRILVGKRAEEIYNQNKDLKTYPKVLKNLAKTDITVKLLIKEGNISNVDKAYFATNICRGHYNPEVEQSQNSEIMQTSSTGYHLDGMSDII